MQPNTLTNAQKYSSAYGFDPGVVVEITTDGLSDTRVGYFARVTDTSLWFTKYKDQDKGQDAQPVYLFLFEIKSIRILSGPWAVWQFAPGDAIGVSIDNPFGDVKFFIRGEEKQFDEYRREKWTFTSLDAPWWWLEGQNGD